MNYGRQNRRSGSEAAFAYRGRAFQNLGNKQGLHLFAFSMVGVPRTQARRKAFSGIIPCFSRFSLISFATAVPNRAKGYYKNCTTHQTFFFFFARNPL
jgi:hypothetical protein